MAGNSLFPQIAATGPNVYIVWDDNSLFPSNIEVFFRLSTKGGLDFQPVINLSQNSGNSIHPRIAISDPIAHIVWEDDTPGNLEIFYSRSLP